MTEYFRSRRPVPLWLVLGIAIAAAPELQRNLKPGGNRTLAMLPILGLAAGAGPLPVAPKPVLI